MHSLIYGESGVLVVANINGTGSVRGHVATHSRPMPHTAYESALANVQGAQSPDTRTVPRYSAVTQAGMSGSSGTWNSRLRHKGGKDNQHAAASMGVMGLNPSQGDLETSVDARAYLSGG